MEIYFWPIALFVLAGCLYYRSISTYDYWKKRKIPYVRPTPLFGNMFRFMMQKENYPQMISRLYDQLDGHPYGGYFEMRNPVLLVRDPKLISAVTIKDFDHFHDRHLEILFDPTNRELNPLSAHLFAAEGDRWKDLRQKLSPGFTTIKLQKMFAEIERCTAILLHSLDRNIMSKSTTPIDIRDVLTNYMIDIVGVCDFGLDCTALAADEKATFVRMCKNAFGGGGNYYRLKYLLSAVHPVLTKIANLPDLPVEVSRFFSSIALNAVSHRKSTGERRNDFLQTLIDLMDDADNFDETDVASNVFIFFAAGFDTTASAIMNCLYHLALNPEVQAEARAEVQTLMETTDGKLTMANTKDLKYLDMVINETLRLNPSEPVLFRVCTKDYRIPGTDDVVSEGTKLIIPLVSLHGDSRLFAHPEKFDPKRFSPENKTDIQSGSYLPFGQGPHHCIGMRFALSVAKFTLARIIGDFSMEPCSLTERPLQYMGGTSLYVPKNGVWLNLKKIRTS